MVSTMKMVDTKKRAAQVGSVAGVRVNKTGRRTFTLEYKLGVVKQCSEPSVSVAAIALGHRINANLLRRWIVRHQRALINSDAKPQPAMLPVAIESTATAQTELPEQIDAGPKRRRPPAAGIEIEIYGARIHLRGGVDAQALGSVLDVLAQR
jgi:transposase